MRTNHRPVFRLAEVAGAEGAVAAAMAAHPEARAGGCSHALDLLRKEAQIRARQERYAKHERAVKEGRAEEAEAPPPKAREREEVVFFPA